MRCNKFGHQNSLSVVQLVEQGLSLFQVARVEAFGEPAVDRAEKIASFLRHPLVTPEPRHAHRPAQLPGLCLLLTCHRERTLEIDLRFRRVGFWRHQRDFSGNAMDLGLAPRFLGCVHRRHRFADAAPSVIELTEFRVGPRQIS
jgi:hypothetical protein